MSWLIKRFKNGKFGLWTTIADGWMTEPKALSREEMIEMIVTLKREIFEKEIKDLRRTFPVGWYDKDTLKKIMEE